MSVRPENGPFGACHVSGCSNNGLEIDLFLYDGEGDESPEVIRSVILCRKHTLNLQGITQIVEAVTEGKP